jgi:uncharacterized protein (TIGR00162 family)
MKDRKWQLLQHGKIPRLNNPLFIGGLPGIGNVGKVAIDFLIDDLNAVKIYEIISYAFPNSVFVSEDNLVELPAVEIFYKKFKGNKRDLILLGGDVQPVDETSSYELSDIVLDIIQNLGAKEVITMGGIGLAHIPKKPKVYCTGNSKDIINKYKNSLVNNQLYGVVGPIIGVSGLLLGLAGKRDIKAVSFLAETYGHPMYLGIKGSREILKTLNQSLSLGIDMQKLDKEIKKIEANLIKKAEQFSQISKTMALKKLQKKLGSSDVDYIG